MFENKIIKGEYATRYIASWLKAGGSLYYGKDIDNFREWLESLDINDLDIYHIINLAVCGKMELERSASEFIRTCNKWINN